jgi:hypothetical protein
MRDCSRQLVQQPVAPIPEEFSETVWDGPTQTNPLATCCNFARILPANTAHCVGFADCAGS